MEEKSWAQQQRENARARADLFAARERAESELAAAHLAQFVAAAKAAGLPAEELVVRKPGTSRFARTELRGWYLKADRSMAVSEDGAFYLLTAPLTITERFRGFNPKPSPPPLILGKGGRDGESIDLVEALDQRLPNWRQHPQA